MSLPGFHTGRAALVTLLLVMAACADNPVAPTDPVGTIGLIIVAGEAQSAQANTELPQPLVVRVTNAKGHPARDQVVNFRVVEGGGSVYAGASLTNKDGIAQEWFTLGPSGPQVVEVRAVDPTSGAKQFFATFNAMIAAPPPPAITPDEFEGNNWQGLGVLGPPLSSGQSFAAQGNFHTLTDEDWYRFETNAGEFCFPGSSQRFQVTITLGNLPAGAQYWVGLYEDWNRRSSLTAVGGGVANRITYSYAGVCGANNDKTFDVHVTRLVGDPAANFYHLNVSYADLAQTP
ncbi:MAG: hypothetical protein H7Z74_10260 [Anaerolineae bacterium]|nr:hypothetical protein [Gemmatimonadaceae bacterium]